MFINRIYTFLERRGDAILGVLLFVFFGLAVIKNESKPLWYDEFYTVTVASQPDWHHFFGAMPPEGNPPINALLTRMNFHLFGISMFSLRLTAMLSFTLALLFLYLFIRRELGKSYGLLAVMLLIAEPTSNYAIEARPYGLMLMFFMMALLGWQAAAHALEAPVRRSRALALTLMGAGIACTILSHEIGIVEIAVPLIVGEGVRSLQRRKLDWPVLLTGLSAIPALMVVIPMIHHTQQVALVHATLITYPITLHKLMIYALRISVTAYLIVNKKLLYVVLFFSVVCLATVRRDFPAAGPGSTEMPRSKFRLYVLAAGVGALALVPIIWLCMIPAGGWFFSRYGIGSVVGISIVTCMVVSLSRMNRLALILLLGFSCLWFARLYPRKAWDYPFDKAGLEFISSDKSTLPIVIADPMNYPSMWWYASPQIKERVVYLKGSVDYNSPGARVVETGLISEKPYTQARFEDFDTFVKIHDRALLRCMPFQTYFLDKWRAAGFEVHPLPGEADMYEVERPSSATVRR